MLDRILAEARALAPAARRLVLMRFLIYVGIQSCYFIGVLGTLTYSMDGEVASTAVVVALLNLFQIVGSFAGGAYLDARGPRLHFAFLVIVMLAVDAFCIVFGGDMSALTFGAACLGFSLGFFEPVSRSYPAYLTADAIELKRINSALSIVSNTGVVVGPLIGGAIASVAPTRAVFAFIGACVVLAVIPAARFRPVIGVRAEGGGQDAGLAAELAEGSAGAGTDRCAGGPSGRPADSSSSLGPSGHPAGSRSSLIEGIRAVFSNAALSFLFWAGFLSYLGYGALDPLESLYYRDVLQVGVAWMGWLSAASGVGAVAGALLVLRIPVRRVTVQTLLVLLCGMGIGCLVYVGTPYVLVALVGQVLLGLAFGMIVPLQNTLVQMHAEVEVIGRANSMMTFGASAGGVIPLLMSPWLAAMLGVQGTLLLASVLVASFPVLVLVFGHQRIARIDAEVHPAA
ncbi:MAG TPA: MFS transporter [Enorma massiliensis]|uniref:MFS transporter n=1 Tax=Enorma massiliensis TaxID=1472761 RepID=UPI001DA79D3C|nr:MFS transporter [Enorma massiliensis]HJG61539.1 MFS transporter [Enorma massiliensis]